MKRLWLLLSFLWILLLLCGCSKNGEVQKIPDEIKEKMQAYESLALLEYGDLKANITVEKAGEKCLITFESPEALRALSAVMESGSAYLSFGGLKLPLEGDGLFDRAAADLILRALNRAGEESGVTASLTDGELLLSGQMEKGSFKLHLDGETGCFLSLDFPEEQLHLEFYEFRFTSPPKEPEAKQEAKS